MLRVAEMRNACLLNVNLESLERYAVELSLQGMTLCKTLPAHVRVLNESTQP